MARISGDRAKGRQREKGGWRSGAKEKQKGVGAESRSCPGLGASVGFSNWVGKGERREDLQKKEEKMRQKTWV